MAKKIQLTIPKPCHEDWDAMSPQDKGRFCGSCQKQVVDFSTMSDRQVAEFFKKPSTGSVCGRFMNDQLDRSLEIPKKRIPWVKYFFSIALPAFFMSLKISASRTQGTPNVIVLDKDTTRPSIYDDVRVMGMIARPQTIRPEKEVFVKGEKGRVVDAITGEVIPGVQVHLYSTIGREHIKVNNDGSFVVDIYRKITVDRIEISGLGYMTQKLKLADFLKTVKSKEPIRLERKELIVGEIAMVDPPENQDEILPVCNKPKSVLPPADFIKGEIGPISKKEVFPILSQSLVGKVGGVSIQRVDEKGFRAHVMNDKMEPIPFASIEITGRIMMVADQNGYFEITDKKAKKINQLVITAAGYESKTIFPAQENYLTGVVYVVLKNNDILPEVVLTSYGTIRRTTLMGSVSKVMGATISGIKIEKDKDMPVVPIPSNNIRVYPNPLPAGNGLNVEWKQTEEGYYAVQLLNASGQSAWQKEIWIDAEARLLNFELPVVATGNYFLVLMNKKSGKKFSEKIIIQ